MEVSMYMPMLSGLDFNETQDNACSDMNMHLKFDNNGNLTNNLYDTWCDLFQTTIFRFL